MESKPKRYNCRGLAEAEDKVERYLNRYPDHTAEVWVDGKLVYRVSVTPTVARRQH